MNYHNVEVDTDVFEFVKGHAEPLVDSFNSTLKRLLKINNKNHQPAKTKLYYSNNHAINNIPAGTPQALTQILKVILLVSHGNSRNRATHIVASEHNVAPQTVIDKYCRQLDLTASKFDYLLSESDFLELRKILKRKFKSFENTIDVVLN